MDEQLELITAGEFLQEEFLEPFGVSQNGLAKAIGVPPSRVNDILKGRRRINGEFAVLLSEFFGTSEKMWLNLQIDYDLKSARREFEKSGKTVQAYQAA